MKMTCRATIKFPGHQVVGLFDDGAAAMEDDVLRGAEQALLDETGVTAGSNAVIGWRRHPVTDAMLYYVAMGEPSSVSATPSDAFTEVKWVTPVEALRRMPDMYGPVKQYLCFGPT